MSDLYADIAYLLEAGIDRKIIAEKFGIPLTWVDRVAEDLSYSSHD